MDAQGTALKQAVKDALAEFLHEQRGLLQEVVAEGLEDFTLAEAVREGLETKTASREDVFRNLRRTTRWPSGSSKS